MTELATRDSYSDGPAWHWFSLGRTAYLVLSRRALCSMPLTWQEKFVALMEEAEAALPDAATDATYWVRRREGNLFVHDPDADYRHAEPFELKPADPPE